MVKLRLISRSRYEPVGSLKFAPVHSGGFTATSCGKQDKLNVATEDATVISSLPDLAQFVVRQDTGAGSLLGLRPCHASDYRGSEFIVPRSVPVTGLTNDLKRSVGHHWAVVVFGAVQ